MAGPDQWTQTLSTPRLTLTGTSEGCSETRQLTDYSATVSQAPSGATVQRRYEARGDLSTSALGNRSVHFETLAPFVVTAPATTPASGMLRVTGDAGSTLRLTALPGGQLLRELDADGDGSFEASSTGAWTGL